MKIFHIAVATICLFLTACTSQPAVRVGDAENVEPVSALGMGCKKPFALTQDCSGWSGPTKNILVGERDLKVGGNAEGTVTVMFSKNSSKATPLSNVGYELLKRELVTRGFEITKVTPIESAGVMFGYAIETTTPSYQIWEEFAVKK